MRANDDTSVVAVPLTFEHLMPPSACSGNTLRIDLARRPQIVLKRLAGRRPGHASHPVEGTDRDLLLAAAQKPVMAAEGRDVPKLLIDLRRKRLTAGAQELDPGVAADRGGTAPRPRVGDDGSENPWRGATPERQHGCLETLRFEIRQGHAPTVNGRPFRAADRPTVGSDLPASTHPPCGPHRTLTVAAQDPGSRERGRPARPARATTHASGGTPMRRFILASGAAALLSIAVVATVAAAGPRGWGNGQAVDRVGTQADVIAEALGLTDGAIEDLRHDGLSLAQIAEKQKVDPQKLVTALVVQWSARIDARVQIGSLTTAQATALRAQLETRAKDMVFRTTLGGMQGAAVGAGPANASGNRSEAGTPMNPGTGTGGHGRGAGNGACDGSGVGAGRP